MMKRCVVLLMGLAMTLPTAALAQHPDHQQSPQPSPAAAPQGEQDPMGHEMHRQEGAREGLLGRYAMTREASGTSWQPDSTPESGFHFIRGPWMMMVHGFATAAYNRQGGPRGETDAFGPTMGMLMSQRDLGPGKLGARAMLSLDPATVGKNGYPLLLQTGRPPTVGRRSSIGSTRMTCSWSWRRHTASRSANMDPPSRTSPIPASPPLDRRPSCIGSQGCRCRKPR